MDGHIHGLYNKAEFQEKEYDDKIRARCAAIEYDNIMRTYPQSALDWNEYKFTHPNWFEDLVKKNR